MGGSDINILHLIDRLEEIVAASQRVPFTKRVLLEERSLLDIIDEMRVSVPENVAEAQRLVGQRDNVLTEAQGEARRMLAAAQEEVAHRITETEIAKAAEAQARAITAAAQQQADTILAEADRQMGQRKAEANDYALDVLRRLETQLDTILNSIRRGIDALEQEKSPPR